MNIKDNENQDAKEIKPNDTSSEEKIDWGDILFGSGFMGILIGLAIFFYSRKLTTPAIIVGIIFALFYITTFGDRFWKRFWETLGVGIIGSIFYSVLNIIF